MCVFQVTSGRLLCQLPAGASFSVRLSEGKLRRLPPGLLRSNWWVQIPGTLTHSLAHCTHSLLLPWMEDDASFGWSLQLILTSCLLLQPKPTQKVFGLTLLMWLYAFLSLMGSPSRLVQPARWKEYFNCWRNDQSDSAVEAKAAMAHVEAWISITLLTLQTASPHNTSSQQQCAVKNEPLSQSAHTHTHTLNTSTLNWFLLPTAKQKN